MANPQAENGHVDIANELAEALALTYLSPTESRIFWAVLRKTWGWKKKTDRISYSQFEQATNLNRRHIAPALKRLVARNIITQTGNGKCLEYGIQKDYERWQSVTETGNASLPIQVMVTTITQTGNDRHKALPEQVTVATITQTGNTPLLKQVTKPLPEQVNTKESKDTLQKKDVVRGVAGGRKKSVQEIAQELRPQFGDIDFDTELVKFKLYWSEGGRQLKRPGLALLNWMLKAREFKKRDAATCRARQSHPGVSSDDELDAQEIQQGIRRQAC